MASFNVMTGIAGDLFMIGRLIDKNVQFCRKMESSINANNHYMNYNTNTNYISLDSWMIRLKLTRIKHIFIKHQITSINSLKRNIVPFIKSVYTNLIIYEQPPFNLHIIDTLISLIWSHKQLFITQTSFSFIYWSSSS
eukprot:436285_1